MAGEIGSGTLSEALNTVVGACRYVSEFKREGTWQRTCDVVKQEEGTGEDWREFQLHKVTAQDITETTENRNYQVLAGTILSGTPTMSQIVIKITDRAYRKLAKIVTSKFGPIAGFAMERKKQDDYLALFSGFSTQASPGTGNPFTSGHVMAAVSNIVSNTQEGSMAEVHTVCHGRQLYDLQTEVVAAIGTYAIPAGMTEEVYRRGFKGTVAGSNVWVSDDIPIDSTPDANAATHAKNGVIHIKSMELKTKRDYDIYYGGGAEVLSLVDEYAFLERTSQSTQVWCYRHLSDATAPSS